MIIEKVLNNNVVASIDPKTKKEVILLGCGIAFNKKIGQDWIMVSVSIKRK